MKLKFNCLNDCHKLPRTWDYILFSITWLFCSNLGLYFVLKYMTISFELGIIFRSQVHDYFVLVCLWRVVVSIAISHELSPWHSCDFHTKTTLLQFKSNSDAFCHRTVCLDCVWGNMRPTSSISSLQQPKFSKREKKKKRTIFLFTHLDSKQKPVHSLVMKHKRSSLEHMWYTSTHKTTRHVKHVSNIC